MRLVACVRSTHLCRCVGHGDPRWLAALTDQAGTLSHTSNLFHTVPQVLSCSGRACCQDSPAERGLPSLQVQLAKMLVESCFADKVFFANSGTEANEAALKFSRKYARLQGASPLWGA